MIVVYISSASIALQNLGFLEFSQAWIECSVSKFYSNYLEKKV